MKRINYWIIILLVLLIFLFVRITPKFFSSGKTIFKNKNIVGVEFKNFKIEFDEKNKNWSVVKNNRVYRSNIDEINNLLNNIKNLQILEVVSKDVNKYKEYSLDESADKIKVFLKKGKKILPIVVFVGKQGGFSYNEFYTRFEGKPHIYLAKGIESRWLLERPFYVYCDKSILNSEVNNIEYIEVNYNNKIFKYKKNLKNGATEWFDVRNNKKIEENKIQGFIKNFENFVADGILLGENIVSEKIKTIYEVKIVYEDNAEVDISIYDKNSVNDNLSSFYPAKIKCYNVNSKNIKFYAEDDIWFSIYEYRYNQLLDLVKK